MKIPKLNKKLEYFRFYNKYTEKQHVDTIIAYLFENKNLAKIDKEILNIKYRKSSGYESMAILHHLGIRGNFKGIFKGLTTEQGIAKLEALNDPDYDTIIALLKNETVLLKDIDLETQEGHPVEEGGRIVYYTARYERNAKNRKLAIAHHGTTCKVCGFDFEKVYGELGKDYIEVHHLVPLSERNEKVIPDPKTEMTVLCSNCHRMIHRKGILKPDELKKLLDEQTLKV